MNAVEQHIEGFRYDRWANGLWLEWLDAHPKESQAHNIVSHMLAAAQIWLLRCQGESPGQMPIVEIVASSLEDQLAGWTSVLNSQPNDAVIRYRNTRGEPFELSLENIVLHVVNHGTYHRGELRGLCRAVGWEDFPETDRLVYSLANR